MTEHRSRNTSATHGRSTLTPRTGGMPSWRTQASLLLEIAPALHGDLGGVELAVLVVAALVGAGLGARRLSRVAPAEIVEVPEGVGGQDEIPHGQGDQIDDHPEDVDEAVRGDDDEDTG